MSEIYGLGGTEIKGDANEAIQEIPQNRTLLVEQLTEDPPVKAEIVKGLTTVEAVFEHYQPKVEVEFETAEGVVQDETLTFSNLGDFGGKGITKQSKFLNDLNTEKDQYVKMIKKLKTNKILQKALADAEAKDALLESLRALILEIEENE